MSLNNTQFNKTKFEIINSSYEVCINTFKHNNSS